MPLASSSMARSSSCRIGLSLIPSEREGGFGNEEDGHSSDNMEDASEEEFEYVGQKRKRKRYRRHTPQQIQEMESFFKEFPHPDEKQRHQLSKKLGLSARQVKFWFQNRRTQLKATQERHENMLLKQEIDQLRAETMKLRETLRNSVCSSCGERGFSIPANDEELLRHENNRLKEELERAYAMVSKSNERPKPTATSSGISNLDLEIGLSGMASTSSRLSHLPQEHIMALLGIERSKLAELALVSMQELSKLCQMGEPLWVKRSDADDEKIETLDHEEYSREFPMRVIGPKPVGLRTEATKRSDVVLMKSTTVVDTLINERRWVETFSCLISNATTLDVICNGVNGTRNGALQLMHAELQVLSPLVPTRDVFFLRYCKLHGDGVWGVVDVSVDHLLEKPHESLLKCRRRPSGCILRDMPNGRSKVTWVEHMEYEATTIPRLFKSIVSSGVAFGAQFWVSTLQKESQKFSFLMPISSALPCKDVAGGRRCMVQLVEMMTNKFCMAVSPSHKNKWEVILPSKTGSEVELRVMTRRINANSDHDGMILTAATSLWISVSPSKLFSYLKDHNNRNQWDLLSNGFPVQEIIRLDEGKDQTNNISVLSANNANDNNRVILQENTDHGDRIWMVVYAPLDTSVIQKVMKGEEGVLSSINDVSLLPSGFVIYADGREDHHHGCGSVLTMTLQIVVRDTTSLTMESIETADNLISRTLSNIKCSLCT